MLKKVVHIGGGAAGFFCAANLDENKFSVKILEQNKDVLQKVKISVVEDLMFPTLASILKNWCSFIQEEIRNC